MKRIVVILVFLALTIIVNAQTSCNYWLATDSINAPSAREWHSSVWTGTEMIIWGGETNILNNFVYYNDGARYNPVTDSWTAMTNINAPSVRQGHSTIWTGTEMIVWGGYPITNTGGKYNPSTDTWSAITTTNAPLARYNHTAVWTGSKMIIWGGWPNAAYNYYNTGGIYDPSTDTWISATSTINAPYPRSHHTAVWTGTEMIIWGGGNMGNYINTGGKYNPSTDTWANISSVNEPTGRYVHTAIWTGTEMIIWGGYGYYYTTNTGGRYNPLNDTWTSTSLVNAPSARYEHSAVWTNSNEMIIWGGSNSSNTGYIYLPSTDSWTTIINTNAPISRKKHTAIWTGSEMIVWGGNTFISSSGYTYYNTGGRYLPCSNNLPSSATATPSLLCISGSSTLGLVGGSLNIGENWNWYSGSCGGTYVTSGTTPTVYPTTTTTYWVRAEGASNTTSCVSTSVIVNSSYTTTNNITINQGQTYFAGGTNQTTSGTYIDTLNTIAGCDSITITNLIIVGNYTISGTFTYDNNISTPLDSIWVYFMINGYKVDSIQTDTNGNYHFNNVSNGTYNITATTNKAWGGVNVTDAILIKKHFAGSLLLNSSLKLHSADANVSYAVNTTDAIKIVRRFSGADTSFDRGDWVFEKPFGGDTINVSTYLNDTIIINGTNVVQDFKGLCIGDVNGSYNTIPLGNKSLMIKGKSQKLEAIKKKRKYDFSKL